MPEANQAAGTSVSGVLVMPHDEPTGGSQVDELSGLRASRLCLWVMFGATLIVVGILWDISWHRTIGRDTFWTPAHLAIQLGGLIGGGTAGWLILRTTFLGTDRERASGVGIFGVRAPLGAWLTVWGCLAMLTSAPFDNWWHDAYGLDVKIISPPHALLALGMWSVVGGALLLVLRQQNNAVAGREGAGQRLFVYGAGVLLAMAAVFLTEMSFPNHQRSATFLRWSAGTYPFYLLGMARASKFRWGATWVAAVYMLITAGMAWVLPLFEGQPKLGPIYHRVDHFVPLPFPLLLVVPALAIDLIRNGIGHGRGWRWDLLTVVLSALAFLGLFAITQWFFSEFIIGPGGQNWFFAADRHWGYNEAIGPGRLRFWEPMDLRDGALLLRTLRYCMIAALISSGLGLLLGNWMAKVRR
jgi:hypothetical protein